MTFVIGEKVVYPNQGIGTIENISSRSFGAQFEKFYLLKLLYSSMTVMVPFSNVTNIGCAVGRARRPYYQVTAFRARCAAKNPHIPCTPTPGGVDDEQIYKPFTGVE